jgi:hypothetical protein
MKQLKKELQAVLKALKALTRKTEQLAKRVDKLDKAPAKRRTKRKAKAKTRPAKKTATRRAAKKTAGDTVLGIIERNKGGVNTNTLKKRTGFDDKKIWNIINRLKQQGKVKSAKTGVYVKI